MAAKIAAFALTFLICINIGVAIVFVMLMVMNGYSESDATYGLWAFVVLAFGVSVIMAVGSFLLTARLVKTISPVGSALIAIAVFTAAGIVLKIVCCLIGIGVAEFVRVNY